MEKRKINSSKVNSSTGEEAAVAGREAAVAEGAGREVAVGNGHESHGFVIFPLIFLISDTFSLDPIDLEYKYCPTASSNSGTTILN